MTESAEAIFQIQGQTVKELKAFIESMKFEKQSEYVRKIRELEEELNHLKTSKKYGIVFEEKREDFEERARNALPVLKEVENMRIGSNAEGPTNIVIEGDNYHALSCLRHTHKGKVDVIYIDPPYNTGNKDFIYNDRYVDKEDTYRHSKWLSFMKKRLVLAQELLSESGVIFISIDDNEQAQLKMLCDEVFGEGNFVANITWARKRGKDNSAKYLSRNHEFGLIYSKSIENIVTNRLEMSEDTIAAYSNPDNDERGAYRLIAAWATGQKKGPSYAISLSGHELPMRRWVYGKETLETYYKEGRLTFRGKNSDGFPNVYVKFYLSERSGSIPETIWNDASNAANGQEEVKQIFGDIIFSTPKPLGYLERILKVFSSKSSLILDFFAGSGTTGHAVLELNREDGGNRQFILCSNREATTEQPNKNICRDITYERVKRVATGYTNSKGESVPGLGGKIRYYQTDFIQIEKSRENLKQKFKLRCNDLIQIKENTFEAVELQSPIPGLYLYRNDERYTVLVYDYLYLDQARDLLRSLDKRASLYIFSISTGFSEEFEDMKDTVEVKHIPEEILEVYLKIFNF